MKELKLDVVRFENEDVITTSCSAIANGSSLQSFKAVSYEDKVQVYFPDADNYEEYLHNGSFEDVIIKADGSVYSTSNLNGGSLTLGTYYHYVYNDETDNIEWYECTDSSHHYN